MKKIWIVAALAACVIALAGCKIVSEPEPIAVQSVTLNETSLTLEYGDTRTLTATVLPLNADNRRVTWSSSDTEVVWVTWDGVITAYKEGTAIIIAQAGDKIATCAVTVKRQPVSANWITLNETSLILRRNESRILTVTVHPENADDKLATWTSSDTGVATVDNNGMVTAVAEGSAIITAKVGSVDASCAVYVNEEAVEQPGFPGAVESVTLNTETLMLAPGSTGTLVATVHPDDAIDKTVIWRAFNPYIATVDDDGNVTAVSEGSTFITAIVGGKTAECEVIVERISVPVQGITLDYETLTLNRNEKFTLTANVTPSNADCTTVIWTSSNDEIAFMDDWDDMFVARNVGTVTITATTQEGGFTATCEVTVNPRPIESITLDKTTLALIPGETGKLGYTLTPYYLDDGDDLTVIWSSSDETVATVNNGDVKALKLGKATITATAQAGGKTDMCEVIVHNHSFTDGKCTVCGANPSMRYGMINENGVLTRYFGSESSVSIPDGVTSIGGYAFNDCKNLTSMNIPKSVTSIGSSAFSWCTGLSSVTIGDGVTRIGSNAFKNCTSLTEITFNGTKAQWNAIEGSDKIDITCIRCSDGHIGVEEVPEYLIISGRTVTGYNSGIPSNLVIPDGVKSIGNSVFKDCTRITSVKIPSGVTSIGKFTFKGCTNLTSVVIPSGVTSIGEEVFNGCTNLANLTIPSGVAIIGDSAFYKCEKLKSVTIPDGIESIGARAFKDCTSLADLTIGDGVTSIGRYAFSGCTSLKKITMSKGVKTIDDYAFYECTSLQTADISSVTRIGMYAFSGCKYLDDVRIDNLTTIWSCAFSRCENLKSMFIPDSVTSISDAAFSSCTGLTTVNIPNSVTMIGTEAFYKCSALMNVTISSGVTSIGDRAFSGCTKLTTVTYKGTKAQWEAISKAGFIYTTIGSFTVKCTDGDVVAK